MPRVYEAGEPSRTVTDYLRGKGIQPTEHWTDVWQEEHANAFVISRITEQRVLLDVQRSLTQAIRQGVPFEAWAREIRRAGYFPQERNLRVIYETNMRMARAQAQWQRIQASKQILPYLTYTLGPSENHREEHVLLSGLTLPVDHPLWGQIFPPNGFGCLCSVQQVTRERALRNGYREGAEPNLPLVQWKDPRSGGNLFLVRGVEPGFAYNPGEPGARRRMLMQVANDIGAPPAETIKTKRPRRTPARARQEREAAERAQERQAEVERLTAAQAASTRAAQTRESERLRGLQVEAEAKATRRKDPTAGYKSARKTLLTTAAAVQKALGGAGERYSGLMQQAGRIRSTVAASAAPTAGEAAAKQRQRASVYADVLRLERELQAALEEDRDNRRASDALDRLRKALGAAAEIGF